MNPTNLKRGEASATAMMILVMMTTITRSKAPYGMGIPEFIRKLGFEFSEDADLTWEALWALSRAYHALALLGLESHDYVFKHLKAIWYVVLKRRAGLSEEELDLSVINRYGELCGSTGQTALTGREQEVLSLVALGCSNRQIAQKLTISVNTVKIHLRNIYEKLGVRSRTAAVALAHRCGLVNLHTPEIQERSLPAGQGQGRNWRRVSRIRQGDG